MTHNTKRLLVSGFILLILVVGSYVYFQTSIDFSNLSVQQLTNGGYYAYVLPDSYTSAFGWQRNIRMGMGQFDWQCEGSHESNWNPVVVRYTDGSSKWLFDISIEEQDALFDDIKATDTITVPVDWIPTHMGISYPPSPSNGTRMKFIDSIGMEVVFSSYLKSDELINLITKLDYVGPSLTTVGNPWEKACQNRQ